MKLNLKACLGALCLLIAGGHASAITEPTFSTTESPVWYQVKFTTGGHVLQAGNNRAALKTADPSEDDNCLWQLIGSADSFKMLSKSGRYVDFNDSKGCFRGANGETKAIELELKAVGDDWEIHRKGVAEGMNQYGGTAAGTELHEWTSGDKNNLLQFVEPAKREEPVWSTDSEETWYLIKFNKNNNVIVDRGVGSPVQHAKATMDTDEMLWKVVGDASNFQIVNKLGHYLEASGDRVKASDEPFADGFSLVAYPGSDYALTWEIKNNRISGDNAYFNLFGGVSDPAAQIGFWAVSDNGNSLSFVLPEDHDYGEFPITGSTTYRPEQPLTLWYTIPATASNNQHQWMDLGLPIGNGQLGAMVLGGVHKEDISVNEKTLWTGDTKLRGSYAYGCYQNFGSLYVSSLEEGVTGKDGVKDYWRNLDLTTGLASVHYQNPAGVNFDRQYLSSNPDNVIAGIFTADKAGALSLNFQEVPGMARNHEVTYSLADGVATIEYHGKFEIVSYCSVIKIVPSGATAEISLAADGQSVDVKNADKVFVVIAAATDYDPVTPSYTSETEALGANVEATAANALAKGWDAIKADAIADHSALFSRVSFNLEGAENTMPTNEMMSFYRSETASDIDSDEPAVKMLEMLYFHYGRYLEIGSSRGVDLPGNLQGIWSGYNVYNPHSGGQVAPWNADIHTNINVQMCYWPAEPTNLSELHLPFLNYIINQATIQPQWRDFAHNVTTPVAPDPDAWTCAVENNIFGGMGSYDTKYSVANAWYCTHIWQHYAYTLDKEFLNRALPTMWGATKFWLDRMVKASDGTYECPSESSPEHGPNQNAVAHAQQIVAELFDNMLQALEVLPEQTLIKESDIAKLKDRYSKMDKGLAIEQFNYSSGWTKNGLKDGDEILREWKYADYTAGADQHRHISHLMCLYPFSQVEPGTREFKAAVNSLRQRGDGATGWSIGWKINLWARAMDGDHARQILRNGLSNNAYQNLFDSHAPYQIDGNFGACTGITEMLLQSRKNVIWILPALPTLWENGEVNGLKAEGDVTVDIAWKKFRITKATLTANKGGRILLGNNDLVNTRLEVNGQPVEPVIYHNPSTGLLTTIVEGLNAGDKLTMVYDATYTQPNVKDEVMSSIDSIVADTEGMKVNVSNGVVTVSGTPAASIEVYDVAGRKLAATSAQTLKLDVKGIVMVKATDAAGNVKTVKATV